MGQVLSVQMMYVPLAAARDMIMVLDLIVSELKEQQYLEDKVEIWRERE